MNLDELHYNLLQFNFPAKLLDVFKKVQTVRIYHGRLAFVYVELEEPWVFQNLGKVEEVSGTQGSRWERVRSH